VALRIGMLSTGNSKGVYLLAGIIPMRGPLPCLERRVNASGVGQISKRTTTAHSLSELFK
jgi:hypothetical protein